MTQFRKKPVVIDAKQASGTPESNREIIDWTRGSATPAFMDTEVRNCSAEHPDGFDYPVLKINTLEGTMTVAQGDWIIKGVKGEFYPCKPDIFAATYEEAEPTAMASGIVIPPIGSPSAWTTAASLSFPVIDPGPDSLEREIQAKADKGPRVTPAALQAEISSVHYFTGFDGAAGAAYNEASPDGVLRQFSFKAPPALSLLTFCVLVLRNGFTVIGHSACASPENYNEEIGQRIACENAEREIGPLLGFRLRDELARPVLTEADALADLAGEPRPS